MKPYERDAVIWLACRHDLNHIKTDLLSTTSRTALHYGMGGAIHSLLMETMTRRGMSFTPSQQIDGYVGQDAVTPAA